MKVLIICSFNKEKISPFIKEQVDYLEKSGLQIEYFLIIGTGFKGYLRNLKRLKIEIEYFKPDFIHAHYGLSGLLANLQHRVPVITTFHGSDINIQWINLFSGFASVLSKESIYVSEKLAKKAIYKGKHSIIPSGVSMEIFFPVDKKEARVKLSLPMDGKLVLFSGSFSNKVKNFQLADSAVKLLPGVRLLELNGYNRHEVNLMLNACDAALLTSNHEGSPQFIKEAMACNRPIVSSDVGDVKTIIDKTEGCFIARSEKRDIAEKLALALTFTTSINGRQRIIEQGLDLETITKKIIDVYRKVSNK